MVRISQSQPNFDEGVGSMDIKDNVPALASNVCEAPTAPASS